ncbi:MAG: homocitrate synthase, partial [Candidatus Omnitrophota bacterium]
MNNKPKIFLIDVTNRDGVQTSRICLSKLQKTMLNIYLNEMGVFQEEFGFPLTHHETNYLNANLELAKKDPFFTIRLGGWLRATKDDVKNAFKLVPQLKHVNLSISTSDQMITNKFKGKLDHESVIKEMEGAVKEAAHLGAESIGVNAEDASRTRIEYLIEFALSAKKAGATRIRYCDTLGCDTPFSIYERIKLLAEAVQIPIEVHCHNDLGLVVANSIAGAKAANDAGVDAYINTCVNGMGERAGNADLVSVILAIKYGSGMREYILDDKVDLKKAWKTCKYASYAFGVSIPINQPGIGANAFAHESG